MTTVNIIVDNDADFYRMFQYKAATGAPINITGAEMFMMLRRHAPDAAALLRLGTDTGEITLLDPVQGKFGILIVQDTLEHLALGDFDHSLIMILGGMRRSVWSGKFTNNAGPSR